MGCATTKPQASEAQLRLEIELHKARAAAADAALKLAHVDAGGVLPQAAVAVPISTQPLTAATIKVGMAARVTSSWDQMRSTCLQTGLKPDERRVVLGESGRVKRIDTSDDTAELKLEGGKVWVPVQALHALPDNAVPQMDMDSEPDAADVLLGLLRLAEALGGDGDQAQLPRTPFQASRGFHFWQGLKSIRVNDSKKMAECVETRQATAVTDEVFQGSSCCEFAVKIRRRMGKLSDGAFIAVGIVDDKPGGFSRYPIGHSELKGTIGAVCDTDSGAVLHDGKIVGVSLGLKDGDVFRVRIGNNKAAFSVNGMEFFSVGIQGDFRMGVSLCKEGQVVEIV